jgi:3-oxoacyl-[acyl-carrier protein] reductase
MIGGKVAVVTGGATGIGGEIASRLASDGFWVAIADLDRDRALARASELRASSGSAKGFQLDVSSAASVELFFGELETAVGRCDVLVNNAGVGSTVPFEELTLATWNKTISVNVTGMLSMTQRAAEFMKRERWGRVVNLSSISGERASTGRTAYGTSKAAILGLTRQVAIELAPFGIVVNAVAPGPIDTPLTRQMHSQKARESFIRHVPLGRYGAPSEVAAAASFLCSDDASYITGITLPVDGGFLAAGVLDD